MNTLDLNTITKVMRLGATNYIIERLPGFDKYYFMDDKDKLICFTYDYHSTDAELREHSFIISKEFSDAHRQILKNIIKKATCHKLNHPDPFINAILEAEGKHE